MESVLFLIASIVWDNSSFFIYSNQSYQISSNCVVAFLSAPPYSNFFSSNWIKLKTSYSCSFYDEDNRFYYGSRKSVLCLSCKEYYSTYLNKVLAYALCNTAALHSATYILHTYLDTWISSRNFDSTMYRIEYVLIELCSCRLRSMN